MRCLMRALPWVGALALLACSGNSFTSAAKDAGAGGSAASGGSAATGGSGGGSIGGAAGGAGAPTSCDPTRLTSCPGASYCRGDTHTCSPCSDFSRFHFAAPEGLAAPNQFADGSSTDPNLNFPRSIGGTGLIYMVSAGPYQGQLYFTPDFTQTAGSAMINAKGESGPVYLPHPITLGNASYNFGFDQVAATDAGNVIHLIAAVFNSGQLSNPAGLPAPFNGPAMSSYQAAVAPLEEGGAPRMWWMMGSGATFKLVTAKEGDTTTTPLEIKADPGGCPADFFYANPTPWVTPDGKWMLFRNVEHDASCRGPGLINAYIDLYRVPLDPSQGTPSEVATPLPDVNQSKTTDTDPSMSPDLCWLYFASNRQTGQSKLRLYRAHRD